MLAKKTAICYHISSGRLTQLVECHLDMVEVAGSSPVPPIERAKFFGTLLFLLFTQLSPDRSAAHFCPGGQSAIVFFGSIPLRERVHGLHFRPMASQFAYRSRPPPKGVAFLEATSLKKTVLTNMGKLSYLK